MKNPAQLCVQINTPANTLVVAGLIWNYEVEIEAEAVVPPGAR